MELNPAQLISYMVSALLPDSAVLLRMVASLNIGAPEFIVKM